MSVSFVMFGILVVVDGLVVRVLISVVGILVIFSAELATWAVCLVNGVSSLVMSGLMVDWLVMDSLMMDGLVVSDLVMGNSVVMVFVSLGQLRVCAGAALIWWRWGDSVQLPGRLRLCTGSALVWRRWGGCSFP